MSRRLSIAIFVFIAVASRIVLACSCPRMPTRCDRTWNYGESVFLGKVTAKVAVQDSMIAGDHTMMVMRYAVHFGSTESFRAAEKSAEDMVVYTGQGGGDCGYPFVVGTGYLVYAYSEDGRLATSICTETSPEVMVGGVLKELRALRDGKRADDLFGTIGIGPKGAGFEDLVDTNPLPNIPVRVSGSRGLRFSTKTDEHGAYAFASLPPDSYSVDQDVPARLSNGQNGTGNPLTVDVGNGAGCRVDVFPRPDGQISGTVVDVDGKGIAGFVTLQPADPKEAEAAMRRGGLPGYETQDGNFSLLQLPPGRYLLVFHPRIGKNVSFKHTFYWPKATDTSKSDAIEVGFGQHIEQVRFEVFLLNTAQ